MRLAPACTVLRIKLMPKKRAARQPHASSSIKRGTAAYSLFSICAVPNCQFIPRTAFFYSLLLSPAASYIHRAELFSLLLFCVGSITLCIMIWRTIKLCCVRSRFPVCFRETSNLLCAVARARKNSEGSHPNLAVRAFQFRFTT
jgi:hypothetical protein